MLNQLLEVRPPNLHFEQTPKHVKSSELDTYKEKQMMKTLGGKAKVMSSL